mgnify:CR=1
MADEAIRNLGWWSISGEAFLAALRRCEGGEWADGVYAELYANCRVERVDPDE